MQGVVAAHEVEVNLSVSVTASVATIWDETWIPTWVLRSAWHNVACVRDGRCVSLHTYPCSCKGERHSVPGAGRRHFLYVCGYFELLMDLGK